MDWRGWRDRWLADPAARARIGRWPIGRHIAQAHADRLFSLVTGFAGTQMLTAALDLGVFERLRAGPHPWADLTDLPPAGSAALRQALVAVELLEERHGCAALTVAGLVVATDPGLRAMIAHNRLLYADLADPVAVLRGGGAGRIANFWPYGGAGDPAAYSALMTASHAMAAEGVLRHPVLATARHVMDVGGGHGAFLLALRQRRPDLALTLADLPEVVHSLDLAPARIAVHGVAPAAALPQGADTAVLIRVLHDQDDDAAGRLLARVAAALPAGGRLLIAEPMAASGRDSQTAYFAAYFAAMRSGRLRPPRAIARLVRHHGFTAIAQASAGPLIRILTARRLSNRVDG